MAAVAQRSMPLQTGAAQICARPDPFQQALIVCPPGFQGKAERTQPRTRFHQDRLCGAGLMLFCPAKALFVSFRESPGIPELEGPHPAAANLETMDLGFCVKSVPCYSHHLPVVLSWLSHRL